MNHQQFNQAVEDRLVQIRHKCSNDTSFVGIEQRVRRILGALNTQLQRLIFYTSIDPSYFPTERRLLLYVQSLENAIRQSRDKLQTVREYADIVYEQFIERERNNPTRVTPFSPFGPLKVSTITDIGQEEYTEPEEPPECAICLNGITRGTGGRFNCGHIFHNKCIEEFFKISRRIEPVCPICRSELKTKTTFFGKNRNTFESELKYLLNI